MKRSATLAALMAAFLAPGLAEARFDDQDARHACKQAVRAQYGADRFRHVTAEYIQRGVYRVTGTAVRHGDRNGSFQCRYEQGRVAKLKVDGFGGGNGDDAGAAIGAAIGVAIGAAIVGAISSDHEHDDYRGGASATHGSAYSPERGITCYPRQRACYRRDGDFAPGWTRREFGTAEGNRPSGPRMSEREMMRYCAGEASARFGRNPRDITTLPVERQGRGYVVYGQFPIRKGGTGFFQCTFGADGRFAGIRRG